MTLKERLRWSPWFTPTRDPRAEMEADLDRCLAKRRIVRAERSAAALRGIANKSRAGRA
jgi:hypothetical protein